MKVFSIIRAAVLLAGPVLATDFLPLEPGNTWTYREARTGETLTVRVGLPFLIDNRGYHSLHGYAPEKVLVRIDENGQLVYIDEERRTERLLTSFEPFERGWWDAPLRQCEQEGQTLEKRGVFDGAAGPIRDVLEIRYRIYGCADTGVEAEQFAENVGMVRRVVSSFAGPRQFDLVYARIGRTTVEALPHSRFTISAELTPGSRNVSVKLRIQSNPSLPLKLHFPTGQEYDVYLSDEDGKLLWRWSSDQVFTQAEHQRVITGEWTALVNMPRPFGTGPMLQTYTVHALMTTSGDSPKFAATLPLTITPIEPEK